MTDAERYRVLHGAGREQAGHLSRNHSVKVLTGPDLDGDLAQGAEIEEAVRLQPRSGGAPLTIGFTTFPGLIVRYGQWHVEAYPACGCDACNEDPVDLIERFRERVAVVVSAGFNESLSYRWRRSVLVVDFGGVRAETIRPRGRGEAVGPSGVRSWPPW